MASIRARWRLLTRVIGGIALVLVALVAPGSAVHAAPPPSGGLVAGAISDPFHDYDGDTPLEDMPLGAVLKTRTLPYHLIGVKLPLETIQVLYRSEDAQGRAVANVTSVIKPVLPAGKTKGLVSYQSFYDSNNPEDSPSAIIAGGVGVGGFIANVETLLFGPLLLGGYTINVPDTEGPDANLASMREYGKHTLNSLRAVSQVAETGVGEDLPIGLMGYSGGGIATAWAAELAPSYAPDIDQRMVGAAAGAPIVHPGHNIDYISGSVVWSGIIPAAFVGIKKAFGTDLDPYLSEYGKKAVARLDDRSIVFALGQFPLLTWAKMVKPEYANPLSVKPYVDAVNTLILGQGSAPTAPLFLAAGNNGRLEGSLRVRRELGPGDGIIVTGDVRALAREYCDAGTPVTFSEYRGLSHVTGMAKWVPQAYRFLIQAFKGTPVASNCGSIKPGNALTPLTYAPANP